MSSIRSSKLVTNPIQNKLLRKKTKNKICKLLFFHVEITNYNRRISLVIIKSISKIIFRFIFRVFMIFFFFAGDDSF